MHRSMIMEEDGSPDDDSRPFSITPLETLAIVYLMDGLLRCVPEGSLADVTAISSDNAATVASCQKLRARKCPYVNFGIRLLTCALLKLDCNSASAVTFAHKLSVDFIAGIKNTAADALSRNDTPAFLAWLSTNDAILATGRQDVASLRRVDMTDVVQANRLSLVDVAERVSERAWRI